MNWPLATPTTAEGERELARSLCATMDSPEKCVLREELSDEMQQLVERAGAAHGFSARQAFAVRRNLLKCKLGMRPFHGLPNNSPEVGRALATAFESLVERHVHAHFPGVLITSEDERKRAARAAGTPCGPTPDLTFVPAITVNGRSVTWIDCKYAYGCSLTAGKAWQFEGRMGDTALRYTRHFGPGAFVFADGFCSALRDKAPRALFLDASAMREEVEALRGIVAGVAGDASDVVAKLAAEFGQLFGQLGLPAAPASETHAWDGPIFPMGNMHCQRCSLCGTLAQRVKRSAKTREWRVLVGPAVCPQA